VVRCAAGVGLQVDTTAHMSVYIVIIQQREQCEPGDGDGGEVAVSSSDCRVNGRSLSTRTQRIRRVLHVTTYTYIQLGCANKNNPLGKINYLSYCKRFFHQILQLLQRRFQAT